MSFLALGVALGIAVFVAGCLKKALRYLRMPAHLRWELYPIPKGRVAQLRTIVEEILTLRMVRDRNPRIWLPSLFFHYGLYLLFALGSTLLASAFLVRLGVRAPWLDGSGFLSAWGALGILLGAFGALGLLLRRGLDPGIRASSAPGDFLNLAWLLALFVLSGGAWLFADRDYRFTVAFLAAILEGRSLPSAPAWFVGEALLLAGFLAYLPATHMTHFFGKWFTWHAVRWNEDAMVPNGALEKEMARLLARPVSWSAAHIGADGKKTWGEIATGGRP